MTKETYRDCVNESEDFGVVLENWRKATGNRRKEGFVKYRFPEENDGFHFYIFKRNRENKKWKD